MLMSSFSLSPPRYIPQLMRTIIPGAGMNLKTHAGLRSNNNDASKPAVAVALFGSPALTAARAACLFWVCVQHRMSAKAVDLSDGVMSSLREVMCGSI